MLGVSQSGVTAPVHRHVSLARRGALGLLALLLVAACGSGGGNGTPTPTRPAGTVNPSPIGGTSSPPGTTVSPGPIGTPFASPWPRGWDSDFCDLFADVVVMQELAVDIGRALEDEARADARGLTRELAETATSVREQLGELPSWEAAAPLENQLGELVDLAERMATRYERHFATNRRNPLNAAREAGGQMNEVVAEVLDRLRTLEEDGLSCPEVDFELETPPEP